MLLIPADERARADAMLKEIATAVPAQSMTVHETLIVGMRNG
jgi:hypothetical protein